MATLLAPYTNGMRLGQGFNSYTQQICLDKAVLIDNAANRAKERQTIADSYGSASAVPSQEHDPAQREAAPEAHSAVEDAKKVFYERAKPNWVKPQIVTYSSRFVEKISDVTGKLLDCTFPNQMRMLTGSKTP